jgi:hypothetical protein
MHLGSFFADIGIKDIVLVLGVGRYSIPVIPLMKNPFLCERISIEMRSRVSLSV